MSKSDLIPRIEALGKLGIAIDTDFNGKSGCIASYTVRKELRNDDGYYEGDGGCVLLDHQGEWGGLDNGKYIRYFDSIVEAVKAAEIAKGISVKEGILELFEIPENMYLTKNDKKINQLMAKIKRLKTEIKRLKTRSD